MAAASKSRRSALGRGRANGESVQSEAKRLKGELDAIPKEVRRQNWQIRFLTEELRGASTDVERAVIVDWLDAAKARKDELETHLEAAREAYQVAMRQRRRARARNRSREKSDAGSRTEAVS